MSRRLTVSTSDPFDFGSRLGFGTADSSKRRRTSGALESAAPVVLSSQSTQSTRAAPVVLPAAGRALQAAGRPLQADTRRTRGALQSIDTHHLKDEEHPT